MELKIEYLPKESLKPYVGNAKLHPAEQVEQIKKSIEEFGFNDPIAIWHEGVVVEGHGRLLAVMEMPEIKEVPVIRLDNLTDEQRRAYMLVHNKLTMNTNFDFSLLEMELEGIEMDMGKYGFEDIHLDSFFTEQEEEPKGQKEQTFRVIANCQNGEEKDRVIDWLQQNNIDYSEL